MTIIGIYAKTHDVDVTGTSIEITKIMSADPRRIGKIEITFDIPDRNICPVRRQPSRIVPIPALFT